MRYLHSVVRTDGHRGYTFAGLRLDGRHCWAEVPCRVRADLAECRACPSVIGASVYVAAQTPNDSRVSVRVAETSIWCCMKFVESGLWLSGLVWITTFLVGLYRQDLAGRESLLAFAATKHTAQLGRHEPAVDFGSKQSPEVIGQRDMPKLARPDGDRQQPKTTGAVAVLRIARLGIEVPVGDGTEDAVLARGAGLVEGTTRPGAKGNVAIAGHRDTFFRGLRNVVYGDLIELESAQRKVIYRVSALAVVEPEDVHVLAETGESALTLVTCYPFHFVGNAPQRYIVRAVPTKSIPPTSRR